MSWSVPNYQDFLASIPFTDETVLVSAEMPNPDGEPVPAVYEVVSMQVIPEIDKLTEFTYGSIKRYRCGCGRIVHPFILVDVRNITTPDNERWVCDGCWSIWQRGLQTFDETAVITDKDIDAKDKEKRLEHDLNKKEWHKHWIEKHGAPDDLKLKLDDIISDIKTKKEAEKNKRLTT